jgi:enolase
VSGADESLELLTEAIKQAGYTGKIQIGLDVAASEFYKDGKYDLDGKVSWQSLDVRQYSADYQNPNSDGSQRLTGPELAKVYEGYVAKYDICSIEDPFDQDDVEAWTNLNVNNKIQIVGDDLTVTNPERIKMAIEKKACNALLLKVRRPCETSDLG